MSLEDSLKSLDHVWFIKEHVYGVLPCENDDEYMVVTCEDERAPFLCECAMLAWHSGYDLYWGMGFQDMIDEFLDGLTYSVEWKKWED